MTNSATWSAPPWSREPGRTGSGAGAALTGRSPPARWLTGARGRRGTPGEVLSLTPLVVATADGALELTRTEWRNAPAPELRVRQMF